MVRFFLYEQITYNRNKFLETQNLRFYLDHLLIGSILDMVDIASMHFDF